MCTPSFPPKPAPLGALQSPMWFPNSGLFLEVGEIQSLLFHQGWLLLGHPSSARRSPPTEPLWGPG